MSIELGKAAEHIVCADLILKGFRAFLSDQGLPYDIVVDLGLRMVRVQVKGTLKPKNVSASSRQARIYYCWTPRRRGKSGKGARLSSEHCDIVALVALDIRAVAYFPVSACGEMVTLGTEHKPGAYSRLISEFSDLGRALKGYPKSLSCKGRRAVVRRNGEPA